ncbi:helix-turn-helix domain-containing protein [Kribbella sp. NBC_01245]|uniref:helix-turn-helix domain-containing protein n=1 Tax=Kribbella sp. NBC_01245 TaxID=2903578 RepID=UPI003FA5E182
MTPEQQRALSSTIKEARLARGYSASELARRSGLTPSTITRIEASQLQHPPQAENLIAIAHALDIPAGDLFGALDWLEENELPSFTPYLRARYGKLSPEDFAELNATFARIAKRTGYDANGPKRGEDET